MFRQNPGMQMCGELAARYHQTFEDNRMLVANRHNQQQPLQLALDSQVCRTPLFGLFSESDALQLRSISADAALTLDTARADHPTLEKIHSITLLHQLSRSNAREIVHYIASVKPTEAMAFVRFFRDRPLFKLLCEKNETSALTPDEAVCYALTTKNIYTINTELTKQGILKMIESSDKIKAFLDHQFHVAISRCDNSFDWSYYLEVESKAKFSDYQFFTNASGIKLTHGSFLGFGGNLDCLFENLMLTHSEIGYYRFSDSITRVKFKNCDLSNALLCNLDLRQVNLQDSYTRGLRLRICPFSFDTFRTKQIPQIFFDSDTKKFFLIAIKSQAERRGNPLIDFVTKLMPHWSSIKNHLRYQSERDHRNDLMMLLNKIRGKLLEGIFKDKNDLPMLSREQVDVLKIFNRECGYVALFVGWEMEECLRIIERNIERQHASASPPSPGK